MPNHITHRLIFAADQAERVFTACCPDGKFSFQTLIPYPLSMAAGAEAFASTQPDSYWGLWRQTHWGAPTNALNAACAVVNGRAVIRFDTHWSVPAPIIAAFAARFHMPFTHTYADTLAHFAGEDNWVVGDGLCFRQTRWCHCQGNPAEEGAAAELQRLTLLHPDERAQWMTAPMMDDFALMAAAFMPDFLPADDPDPVPPDLPEPIPSLDDLPEPIPSLDDLP